MKIQSNKNSYFSNSIFQEIDIFKKYLKFNEDKKLKIGNKNWLILDSSQSKYLLLIPEIMKITDKFKMELNITVDDEYFNNKISENKLNSNISSNNIVNILVVSNISEENALNQYSDKYTFFANLDKHFTDIDTEQNIKDILKLNNFKLEDETLLNNLNNIDTNILERTLTHTFIRALSNKSNIIKSEYLIETSNNLADYLKELEHLIGLNKAKETIKEIVNYLQICKNRSDMPCLNMCFLGNPRHWKDNSC